MAIGKSLYEYFLVPIYALVIRKSLYEYFLVPIYALPIYGTRNVVHISVPLRISGLVYPRMLWVMGKRCYILGCPNRARRCPADAEAISERQREARVARSDTAALHCHWLSWNVLP
jgi:hypothetical protein